MKKLISALRTRREIKVIEQSELFDEQYYVTHYPETCRSKMAPIEHYVRLGSAAGLKPNAFFDDRYYRECNPDVGRSNTNPLVHFIKFGANELRNPSPSFNTRYYLEQHPDITATGANPLWHFLKFGAAEHRATDNARVKALSGQCRVLYDELAQIEPLLPDFEALKFVPLDARQTSLAGRAYFRLLQAIEKPFTHMLALRRLIHGGATTLAMHYANLIKEASGPDSIMVLLTDEPDQSAIHMLPPGISMLVLDELQPGLSDEEKIQVLARLIIEFRPQTIHNMDSDICWQAFERYHRQFHPATSLVASLFMFTYNQTGRKAGNASSYLNSCIDNLDLILTDNHSFKNEAVNFYALEQEQAKKIEIVYTPILSPYHEPDYKAAKAKNILWSSRLHRDKRPDLLAEIARLMPDFVFQVYGDCALDEAELAAIKAISNIKLHGPYLSSQDLPYKDIGAYLHTTRHEGGAITLKEAVAAGLPAVGPAIGLISEILRPDTGWLVAKDAPAGAYCQAIRDCLADPDERVRRIRNAQQLLKQEHSWECFRQKVSNLPAYRL